jgi:RNA polymerase sigma-70 factor (ECF subfamily)
MTEFEKIYRRHYAQMYRLARVMLYDSQESKDVVSDVFAQLLHRGQMPAEDKVEGYLMTAVRNRCSDVLSHKSVRERVEKLFLQESVQNSIYCMNDDDRLERLMQFVEAELPPLSRQIFQASFSARDELRRSGSGCRCEQGNGLSSPVAVAPTNQKVF